MDTAPAPDAHTADVFEAFDRFPWSKSRSFLFGLIETLGGPDALRPNPTHEGSTAFCRTVFFHRQTGRRVDLIQYSSFVAAHPEYPSVDRRLLRALYAAAAAAAAVAVSSAETTEGKNGDDSGQQDRSFSSDGISQSRRIADAVAMGPVVDPFDGTPTPPLTQGEGGDHEAGGNVPSWQRSAPRNELRVAQASPAAPPHGGSSGDGGGSNGEAPYSDKFAKIVEAIQTGKEVEGIRHIPDTVVRQPGVTPVGKLKAPQKPWEKAAAAAAAAGPGGGGTAAGTLGVASLPLVDAEFPPPASPEAPPPAATDGGAEASADGAQPS
ncbi:hypothetical protein SPI_03069 [Niveomyces insectorum RCEF 264]|uniref:Uncharacterized protein n=1 Tax=Niveomyces insectorum RCEF 264 TaxID=1081102 RepID=A0A162J6G9_9HYPO|nr:hypothetical protein SPI_03069 [Niveomyces insectorum RCEF 264]